MNIFKILFVAIVLFTITGCSTSGGFRYGGSSGSQTSERSEMTQRVIRDAKTGLFGCYAGMVIKGFSRSADGCAEGFFLGVVANEALEYFDRKEKDSLSERSNPCAEGQTTETCIAYEKEMLRILEETHQDDIREARCQARRDSGVSTGRSCR